MNTKRQLLFCPGPVHVAKNVKKVAVEYDICHREENFSSVVSAINDKLLKILEIKRANKYTSVVVTGSASAANESVIATVTSSQPTLIITNGEFGNRLVAISRIHNTNTHVLDFDWAKKVEASTVEKYLLDHPKIKNVMMVHHETSTGMLNPIKQIGLIAKKNGVRFIVDAVSSIGAEDIDMEGSSISFCIGATGKALGSFPGMAFVVGKVEEFEKLKDVSPKTMYLHLYNNYHYSKTLWQTPNTPAVPSFLALNQALINILHVGVNKYKSTIAVRAQYLRSEMKKIGLKFLIDETEMSSVLTTVLCPKNIDVDELRNRLRKKSIIVYGGKGPFLKTAFQVANIGDLKMKEVKLFIKVLKEVLHDINL